MCSKIMYCCLPKENVVYQERARLGRKLMTRSQRKKQPLSLLYIIIITMNDDKKETNNDTRFEKIPSDASTKKDMGRCTLSGRVTKSQGIFRLNCLLCLCLLIFATIRLFLRVFAYFFAGFCQS